VLWLSTALSQSCQPQPNLSTCFWYQSNSCCTPEQDFQIGEILSNITAYNEANIEDPTARAECNIRMSFLVCKPCAPATTYALPVCSLLCESIAYRCGSQYSSGLLAQSWSNSVSIVGQLDLGDSSGSCASCSVCASSHCWNFALLTKATLITLLLPILLMLL